MNAWTRVGKTIIFAVLILSANGCASPQRDEEPNAAHHRMLEDSYDRRFGRQYDGDRRVDPHSRPSTGFSTTPEGRR